MTYQQTIDFLFTQLPMYQRVGKIAFKKDLTNTYALMSLLDEPHEKFKSIHIAGTNGKGSVSHILAGMFQAHGYKVGLYSSPHYKDFRERIKINGQLISKSRVISFVQKNRNDWDRIRPSFFEITVAMAFDYFAQQKVDIAIIETGLGGRLDSTNVITPMLSVITNIDYDHMDMLGETLPEIAFEKAGIIKHNVPVVVGRYDTSTGPVFQKMAQKKKASIRFANKSKIGHDFLKLKLKSDINGPFQDENKRTAWMSFITFRKYYSDWMLREKVAQKSFRYLAVSTGYIGRWQWLQRNPGILVDSAHNEQGLKTITKKLREMKYENLHLVLGFVKGKDIEKLLRLFPSEAQFYISSPNVPRGCPVTEIEQVAVSLGLNYEKFSSIKKAMNAAKKVARKKDLIFAGGSSFVTAEVI